MRIARPPSAKSELKMSRPVRLRLWQNPMVYLDGIDRAQRGGSNGGEHARSRRGPSALRAQQRAAACTHLVTVSSSEFQFLISISDLFENYV